MKTLKTIKCKICGYEFPPIVEDHYVSRDCGKSGITTAFSKDEEKLYDTFDCPLCGCQAAVQERKRAYIEYDVSLEEETEEGIEIEEEKEEDDE